MKNLELDAIRAELKKLSARVTALEKLLDRIIRQKPVSGRQLEKALKFRGSLELDRSCPPSKRKKAGSALPRHGRDLETVSGEQADVRLWHIGDIPPAPLTNVRFWGQSGH